MGKAAERRASVWLEGGTRRGGRGSGQPSGLDRERITEPAEIVPAIRRGIAATENGTPALLEFITSKEVAISTFT